MGIALAMGGAFLNPRHAVQASCAHLSRLISLLFDSLWAVARPNLRNFNHGIQPGFQTREAAVVVANFAGQFFQGVAYPSDIIGQFEGVANSGDGVLDDTHAAAVIFLRSASARLSSANALSATAKPSRNDCCASFTDARSWAES